MEKESNLEKIADEKGKFKNVIHQLEQYFHEKKHLNHYIQNCIRILLEIPIINYRVISHENNLAHSSEYHRII